MPKREGWVNVYPGSLTPYGSAVCGVRLGTEVYTSKALAEQAQANANVAAFDVIKIEWFEPDPLLPMTRYVIREHGKTGSDGWYHTKEEAEAAMKGYRGGGDWYVAKQTTEHC